MKAFAAVALLLLVAASAAAQEFDIFDLNDFVDPRLRGAVYDESGLGLVENGVGYRVIRLATGGISNYAWRNRPMTDEVAFVHLVSSAYTGATQMNVKVSLLTSRQDDAQILPRYRVTGQLARYQMAPPSAHLRKLGVTESIAGRWLLAATIEENRFNDPRHGPHRSYNGEFGGELDLTLPLPRGRSVSGSFIATARNTQYEGWTGRLTYYYRLPEWQHSRIRFGSALGAGIQRTDAWHLGALRMAMRTSVDVPRMGTLNLTWTPTYLPGASERSISHELAIFVDRTLFSRVLTAAVAAK